MYSIGIAYLLWFLSGLGALGFHRFYLGKIPTGILWMFTGGLGMFGSFYDFFTLGSQVREANLRNALFHRPRQSPNISIDQNWRNVDDGKTRFVRPDEKPGDSSHKDSPERVILKLAKENRGVLTVSEVALGGNIPLDEAKKMLETLVSKGMAELRVRKTGALVYVMEDFRDRDEPLEDF